MIMPCACGKPARPICPCCVQTNEVLRLFRNNFYEQTDVNSPTRRNVTDYDGFFDWSFNRRLMIEFDGAYQWADSRSGPDTSGGNPGILTRVKLIDTESSSCCFNFKVLAPNVPLAVSDTTFTYGLAGFEDLAYWFNWDRVGLYYSVVFETLSDPAATGAKRIDVQYNVSIAKTFTAADAPIFRKLTLFEENFAQTDLDGPTAGRTYVTITPGLRFNFANLTHAKMGTDNAVILARGHPDIGLSAVDGHLPLHLYQVFLAGQASAVGARDVNLVYDLEHAGHVTAALIRKLFFVE